MNKTFDLWQLDAFCAVMTTGGITTAAQLLGRSQPPSPARSRSSRRRWVFALLERSGRGVTPTERGRKFYIEVERHLAGLQHLSERAGAIRIGSAPTLDIAAIPAFAAA